MKRNLLALPLLAVVSNAYALPGLDPFSNVSLDNAPSAFVLANVDGDAAMDFVVADSATATFTVYFGASDGSIDEVREPLVVSIDAAFQSIATGDFNEDGWPDVAGVQEDDVIVTWLNADDGFGDRSFAKDETLAAGTGIEDIIAGDLDGAGGDDVAVANAADDSIHVFLNDGGFDSGSELATGDFPVALAFADVENDTDNDVLVLNAIDGTLQVFLNSAGTLSPDSSTPTMAGTTSLAAAFPVALTTAKIDSDAYTDVMVANLAGNEIRLLTADGTGGFDLGGVVTSDWQRADFSIDATPSLADDSALIDYSIEGVARMPRALGSGDVNGDGHADLVVAATGRKALLVFPGNGVDGFDALQVFAAPAPMRDVAVAKLDSDGYADAAALSVASLDVFLSQDISNRAPVVLDDIVMIDECTTEQLLLARDVDGDELVFGQLALVGDHPVATHFEMPLVEITANDTGDAATLDVATLSFTVFDGTDYSDEATISIRTTGNATAGDCDAGTGLEVSGDIFASESVTLASLSTLSGVIQVEVEGEITLSGGSGGGGSGGGGSVSVGSDGTLTIGDLMGSGTITIDDENVTVVAGGTITVTSTGSLVVVVEADSGEETDAGEAPEDESGEPAEEATDDESETSTDESETPADESTSGNDDEPEAGGGAWSWLLLPLLFLRRRRD